jgi:nucleoside-diphosphate-sugar epimerase
VRVLVTGIEGGPGCPLAPTLFEDGHEIAGQGDERSFWKERCSAIHAH